MAGPGLFACDVVFFVGRILDKSLALFLVVLWIEGLNVGRVFGPLTMLDEAQDALNGTLARLAHELLLNLSFWILLAKVLGESLLEVGKEILNLAGPLPSLLLIGPKVKHLDQSRPVHQSLGFQIAFHRRCHSARSTIYLSKFNVLFK